MEYVSDISQSELHSIIEYNPSTGSVVWRYRPDMPKRWNTRWAGKPAGSVKMKHGKPANHQIRINYRIYMTHHLAWLYVHGEWPSQDVDHEDLNPLNNRIDNLRLATNGENSRNRVVQSNSKSGVKGVHQCRKTGRWIAKIGLDRKQIWLGMHDTKEEAAKAYAEAAIKYHGEFARVA